MSYIIKKNYSFTPNLWMMAHHLHDSHVYSVNIQAGQRSTKYGYWDGKSDAASVVRQTMANVSRIRTILATIKVQSDQQRPMV